jgi:hypothetical protein
VGIVKHENFLFLCIGVPGFRCCFGLMHLFCTSFSVLVSGLYMHFHNFYLKISCYFLFTKLDIRCIYSNSYTVKVVRQKNMVMGLTGLGTKNDCAGEGQQQFTQNGKTLVIQ